MSEIIVGSRQEPLSLAAPGRNRHQSTAMRCIVLLCLIRGVTVAQISPCGSGQQLGNSQTITSVDASYWSPTYISANNLSINITGGSVGGNANVTMEAGTSICLGQGFQAAAAGAGTAFTAALSSSPQSGALSINSPSAGTAIVGAAYFQRFLVAGGVGPYTWSFSGTLPSGLTSNGDGFIFGNASSGSTGTYTITAQAQDALGGTAAQTFNLTVATSYPSGNFQFTSRGHTYTLTMATQSSSGLQFPGHWLYEPSVILPSSLTSNNYVLLFNSNTTDFTPAFPTGETIYMQTSSDGLNWGTPTPILSKASNICDMADAKPIYDTNASLWRVFVQAVEYTGGTCGGTIPWHGQLFEATGSSLTSLTWYGSGGNATSLSGDLGSPGLGEVMQWFNTANYNGPSATPLFYIYNNWSFTTPDSTYCPSCGTGGDAMFGYLTADAETSFYFWYYTSPAYAFGTNQVYLDFLLGGSADQATLGPPGFSFGDDCTGSGPGTQVGSGVGFYPTPVPNNTSNPSLPGQFISGTFSSSTSGLIVGVRAARNPYGFIDKVSSSPNTWSTYLYYNIANEKVSSPATACPEPTIQDTFKNSIGSGHPASFGVSLVTITEQ